MHYDAASFPPWALSLNAADTFDYDAALAACARGDAQALQRIYRHAGRYLLGVALRIVRERAQAEDVLHDAFISIWQRAGSFDAGRGAARGWIYSVVRHAALNVARGNARDVRINDEALEAIDDQAALHSYRSRIDPYELGADLGKLDACLGRLEPARRDCILLAYVEGCSHGEIAERTHTPLGTVKAWIQRGLRALRECMA